MDSMLLWTLVASSGLGIGVGILAGYLGFVAGRRDFLTSRLPGSEARANKTKPARKVPTEAQLKRLNLYQGDDPYGHYENLPALFAWFHVVRTDSRIMCGTCMVSLLLVREYRCDAPHDQRLCVYCPNCFRASVFPNVMRRRRILGQPELQDNFLDILETLENEAATQDSAEPEKKPSFTATVEGTGGLRQPPMRVRVDPDAKTVRPLEVEPEPAEAEVALFSHTPRAHSRSGR